MRLLDLQDFLDATTDSSRRTRTILITLVVACVLSLAGFLNSLPTGWMLQRMQTVSDPASAYVEQKLGVRADLTDDRYRSLQSAITRAYVDNVLTVRVPFFGITFDINDLGLIAGIAFVTLLTLLRFGIRTETISLRLAFKAATEAARGDSGQLESFYDLLAMRQVFTFPPLEDPTVNWVASRPRILRMIPKLICLLPVVVYSLVAIHDYATMAIGSAISPMHARILLIYTGVFWLIIVALALWCFVRLIGIDRIWEEYWLAIRSRGAPRVQRAQAVRKDT
jgi:hypothetical protein